MWDAGNKSRQPCALLGRSGCGFCPKCYRAGAAPCQEQQASGARGVHAALHPEQLLPQKNAPSTPRLPSLPRNFHLGRPLPQPHVTPRAWGSSPRQSLPRLRGWSHTPDKAKSEEAVYN